jgi:type I restriction-modification system DNA methylase subunit
MIDKLTAKKRIADLVTRFEDQYSSYKNSDYNETQTRRDFIDPFFKALGWDIDNEEGYAEAYREVIHEDKVKISGATKAPDYSFRLVGGKRLFFVEAKKPSISVKDDIQPAYQIRRYGWSAKLPISIISDFEEFAIYDCTKKPDLFDKSSVSRIKYFTFREYEKEFDFIWETFSKEQVLKGSFDKFIQSDTRKKGTATVDKEFLESLDRWRTYLAVNISWNNKELNEDEINFAVQQTIDRLIFLRIAEDRSVEPYGNLKHAINQGNLYSNLFDQFRKADEKYNSGLFDLKKDRISENLVIENKVIRTIINELYYPECPYEFSVLPVEILGSAYEQFLGKVIRITPAHHAKIEEKPEVRKAGGVYYTPQYIVEYIVKNTVGKLIDEKTPAEISKIKIVDPACGSGSFLIGAFQYLLDYHKDYYTDYGKISKGKKDNPLTPEGHLTTAEKKRVLLNNIFGVDLDVNAVEVTKLSLLIKCLEGETEASIQQQFQLWNERLLPTLENNIKSGNSLIDTDYYDNQLDFGEEKKIKPFNWQNAFPEVFKKGGFDVVIGNPPYIRIQSLIENSPTQGTYFSTKYKAASKGNYDIYVIFIEHSLNIINSTGCIGFILPHKFFTAQYGEGIRRVLFSKNAIEEIVHFGHQQVFNNATTYTCILILSSNRSKEDFKFSRIDDLFKWRNSEKKIEGKISLDKLSEGSWNFISGKDQELFNKLNRIDTKLENVTDRIFQGLKTSADKIFIVKKIAESKDTYEIFCPQNEKRYTVEKELFHPLIKGGDSRGYIFSKTDLLILFPYSNSSLLSENELKQNRPLTYEYLKEHKNYLENRENSKMKTSKWYGYVYPKALDVISTPKLFTPDISPNASFAIDKIGETFFTGGVSGGYGIKVKNNISVEYILGLLNSNLLNWFLKQISTQMKGGWYSFESKYIKHLPIKIDELNNVQLVGKKEEIKKLVNQLIQLNIEKTESTLQTNIEQLDNKIDYCQRRINKIVYELYELTEEEINIIEGDN